MKKEEPIYELLGRLYFVEGLEDIKNLYYLNRKSLEKWCIEKGEKICQIIYCLIMQRNPKYILNQLKKEDLEIRKNKKSN
jgi:hypothetical protein